MKDKKKESGLALAALLTGVLFGTVVGLVLISYAYPVFQSDKWAAWVQAVGSVGAVVAAIYVMNRQVQMQKKAQVDKDRELLVETIGLIQEGARQIRRYIDGAISLGDLIYPGSTNPLKVWQQVFHDIEITLPALMKIAVPVANVRLQINTLIMMFEAIEKKEPGVTIYRQQLTLRGCCDSIDRSVESCLKRIGTNPKA